MKLLPLLKTLGRTVLLSILVLSVGLLGLAGSHRLDELLYPLPHREAVMACALSYDLPESLIYAVIKAESDFDPLAVSEDGARGLMQMMEPTFSEMTGKKYLNEHLSFDALFVPEVSIRYGSYYLRYLSDLFGGDLICTLAAYNGGLGNVRKWLADPAYSDGAGHLTSIPFPETRAYVERVTEYAAMYEKLYFTPEGELT